MTLIPVKRDFEGRVMVIIEGRPNQGFIFEPGAVRVDWVADSDKHPRDTRLLSMVIVGPGRTAATWELPGQQHPAREPDADQHEQHQLGVGEEVPPPPTA